MTHVRFHKEDVRQRIAATKEEAREDDDNRDVSELAEDRWTLLFPRKVNLGDKIHFKGAVMMEPEF